MSVVGGNPSDDPDSRIQLRVFHLSDRHHGGIEDLATFGERRFTLAAELAKTMPAFPITRRHRVAQCRCLASPWPVL